jgi:hypothetical protein
MSPVAFFFARAIMGPGLAARRGLGDLLATRFVPFIKGFDGGD